MTKEHEALMRGWLKLIGDPRVFPKKDGVTQFVTGDWLEYLHAFERKKDTPFYCFRPPWQYRATIMDSVTENLIGSIPQYQNDGRCSLVSYLQFSETLHAYMSWLWEPKAEEFVASIVYYTLDAAEIVQYSEKFEPHLFHDDESGSLGFGK